MGIGTELWVIETSESETPYDESYEAPQLKAVLPESQEEIPLPLKHTDVKAQIDAYIATAVVTQEYHNPYEEKIEAVYVFPLPQNAAVTDFLMIIGDREIRGMIREREQAERIYEEAKSRGYRAAILTQERPNIFTQKVANIEPGHDINIQTTFFNPLKFEDGEYEFVFPTVVGPRFNPPGFTEGVGAVARGKEGSSGQETEVSYLKPGEFTNHDISIEVDIDAGVEIEEIYCKTHAISVKKHGRAQATVSLSPNDGIPNKDFVLRYRVAGDLTKTAMLTHRTDDGNYFSLVLQPPIDEKYLPRMPREMVFVLDCSGSMSGEPIAKAKSALRRCLQRLDENDTFQIIRFSDNASSFGPDPVPATPENIKKALLFVYNLRGGGGTMMIEGIKAALNFPHDENRLRIVSFMTDGYIGNEAQILGSVHDHVGASRIFSFGVGTSVNRYLLERMAQLGRGAVAYVNLDDNSDEIVDQFYRRATYPALTDVSIDWGGIEVTDVYPRVLPDLFVGRPIVISGRFQGRGKTSITIHGRSGSERRELSIPVDIDSEIAHHKGIRSIWARWKLAELSNQETYSPSEETKAEMTEISIDYGLICKYTAFLAVDSFEKTADGESMKVNVPVYVPEGVKYETTVQP